ncbi:hypothetical protein [Catellatospora sp. NPDC049133]|uniref:hypothetical protein n=1 Tax=Catellatospora sp. NPDC049133 TaxID=3155499 RepID=UPI0033EA956D
MTRQRIVMSADYCCGHPLSVTDADGISQVRDPASLPISEALVSRLAAWKRRFDQTLDHQYPPDSGFASPNDEHEFYADGLVLATALALELLDSHVVEYHDDRYPEGLRELRLLADGAVFVDDGRLVLPAHWSDLAADPDRRHALLAQFEHERAAGHVLEGKPLVLLARCTRCDDILFRVQDDGRYAVVHLTRSSSREPQATFPWTDLHENRVALLADLSEKHYRSPAQPSGPGR